MNTRLENRVQALPLFWKVYGFIAVLLIVVVGLAEGILEPVAKNLLEGMNGGFQTWHEAIFWAVSILLPTLACGFILSKILTGKLEKIARASKALARGNLEVRLPVTGNVQDAFDVLAQSFNEMAEVIKTQQQMERRLLADISHELRSPLTRVGVATELLDRRHTDEASVAITRRIEKEVARMNDMVALLLTQAKDKLSTAGENTLVDTGSVLRELVDDFAFQGEAQRKKIHLTVAGNLKVYGNAPALERMIGNILSNAIFYSPPDAQVQVTAERQDNEMYICIRDFGSGVPEEQLEDIFRTFYRVDGSHARASGGAGLGLALAREAAIQHGGNIVAHNASPGLRVTVTLPAYIEEESE